MKIEDRTIEIAYRCSVPECEAMVTLTTNVCTRAWIDEWSLHPACPLHQERMVAVAVKCDEPFEFVDLHLSYITDEQAVEEEEK